MDEDKKKPDKNKNKTKSVSPVYRAGRNWSFGDTPPDKNHFEEEE